MYHLRTLDGQDVRGKKVLVRIDCNVELDEKRDVREKYKVAAGKRTIDWLLAEGAKVALATHFGRPEGKRDEKFSVRQIADDVERILGIPVRFADDCVGEAVAAGLAACAPGEALLLENVRFHPGEEENDPAFARELAAPFDLFVNEAFSVCHRDQASVTGVTAFLPSFAGWHLVEEVERLTQVLEEPDRPAVAIIGGAKIETKLPMIQAFEARYDTVLVGSKIATEAKERGLTFSEKVRFPTDFAGDGLDIGEKTQEDFASVIASAKTVVWNGPLGKFEEPPYDTGTRRVLEAVVGNGAFSVMGGGESVQVLEEWGMFGRIGFVSTGGGAMLDFLGGVEMPGLKRLSE